MRNQTEACLCRGPSPEGAYDFSPSCSDTLIIYKGIIHFVKNHSIYPMETRKHIAAEKKRCNSHNCAQAVLHTYADIAGLDEATAMNVAGAFGAGMGNLQGTCGALVGAGLVLGLVNRDKLRASKQMRQIMTRFQERNGATQCYLLKGVGTKEVLRQCPDCVADAAEFLEEQLTTNGLA